MYHKYIFIIILNLQAFSTTAQLTGMVQGSEGEPLYGAIVSLSTDSSNNHIIAFAQTNNEGHFKINIPDTLDSSFLHISYLGYNKAVLNINPPTSHYNIVLLEQTHDLKKIIVSGKALPITQHNDTIVYQLNEFRDSTEDVIEDLLKKLPGLEVDKEGLIKVNGKSIQTVLIEDSDMLGNEYTLGTKNINANHIDRVEIIKNYQKDPTLSNINLSEAIALNLKLKENKKNVITGNLSIGAGGGGEFKKLSSAKVFYISKLYKFLAIGNYENLGTQYSLRNLNYHIGKSGSRDLTSTVFSSPNYTNELSLYNPGIPNKYLDNGNNRFSAFRSDIKLTENSNIQINGHLAGLEDMQEIINNETYIHDNNTYKLVNHNLNKFNEINAGANLTYSYIPVKDQMSLMAHLEFNHINSDFNQVINNTSEFGYQSITSTENLFSSIKYTKSINENNAFQVLIKGQYSETENNSLIKNKDISNYLNDSLIYKGINQSITPKSIGANINGKWYFKYSDIMGEVYLKYQNQQYNLQSDIRSGDIEHIFGNNIRGYKINNSLSSLVTNLKYFIGKGYKIRVRADLNILKATTYEVDKISLNSLNAHIELSKTYRFGLETKLSYRYVSQLPNIYNFINFTHSRSPFEIINSNIYNLNTENHLTSLSLSYNDVFNSRNVFLTTLYSFGKKFWLNKLNFFKTIIEKEPFYSVGNNFLRVHGSFDQFFPDLKSGIKIKPRFYYAKNVNNINNFETSVIYQIREVDVDIYTSLFSPVKFNLDFMYSQNVSYAKNNYADRNKTDIFNANTSFLLDKDRYEAEFTLSYFKSHDYNNQIADYLSASFQFAYDIKIFNDVLNTKLNFVNIFNQKYFTRIYSNDLFVFSNNIELLEPYVYATVTWRF